MHELCASLRPQRDEDIELKLTLIEMFVYKVKTSLWRRVFTAVIIILHHFVYFSL